MSSSTLPASYAIHVALGNDINFNGATFTRPFGTGTRVPSMIFDGRNPTIKDASFIDAENAMGLFSSCPREVKNLKINNFLVRGSSNVGVLCASAGNTSSIESVMISNSKVYGENSVGGAIGLAGSITSSKSLLLKHVAFIGGEIYGEKRFIGGLIGRAWYTIVSNSVVKASLFSEIVAGNTTSVGGIVGSLEMPLNKSVPSNSAFNSQDTAAIDESGLDLTLEFFRNKGYSAVLNSFFEGTLKTSGAAYAGGIAGSLQGSIVDAHVNGNILATGAGVGGIVGSIYGSPAGLNSFIRGSSFKGTLTGGSAVGGIAGYSSATIQDSCVNQATISGQSMVGGIAGEGYVSRIFSSSAFANIQTVNSSQSGGIFGVTNAPKHPTTGASKQSLISDGSLWKTSNSQIRRSTGGSLVAAPDSSQESLSATCKTVSSNVVLPAM